MSLYSVNAGMQVGNIKDFIKFTQFMRKYGDEHTHKGREDDQHFLTFSMALKKFDEILNYQILNYSSDFMVAGSRYYMNHPKKIKGQKFGNWSVNGKVPVIYHQFDRTNYYITQIKRKCKLHGILADHTSIKS
ncbi:hypothetical protein TVAG_470610 [Trichomonas vaginalis G3]|uniref:Uncharacterized protein n=1 Tax=Trichomonas vaginalis (strain ATCC PRA-98 / G3) TaxID=412133 RepID=A2EMA6_TRIV3|nr:hypothetical protein TVAGG3_0707440 [Trichomonas vaginalis G3]EAY06218.1 hypothetical protein TVAG_470610 [Trichomonas vaginalis G3]KAI5509657.1 hypothetical protein TVAGG3_0707440 [Trichomonas vaginalis G3]|eukprot:XP_001318441.1 hypothetical protein [Trichomonas vaginalis G3]